MLRVINRIFKRGEYQPLNRIKLSQKNLLGNYKYLSSLDHNISISPVLKSNGYGHGLIQIATVLDSLKCPFFCVDSLYEAYELVKIKVKTPILIMGYVDSDNLRYKKLPFSYTVWSLDQIRVMSHYQPDANFHLFVDTGMNREGVAMNNLAEVVRSIRKMGVKIEGLMSHLASSAKSDPQPKLQLKNFRQATKICQSLGIDPKWKHLAASGGLWNGYTNGTNMARVGRGLYGMEPNDQKGLLKGVLTLKTKIIQIKKINKGLRLGYDGTYSAKKDTLIGILPIGYNDGVDRRLSNIGVVEVGGLFVPIIGRISMNVTTIDLTQVKRSWVGQEVVVFSSSREDPNSIENTAKLCQTLPHDILVGLDPSIRREVV